MSNRPHRRIARLATKTQFASLEVERILMEFQPTGAGIAHCYRIEIQPVCIPPQRVHVFHGPPHKLQASCGRVRISAPVTTPLLAAAGSLFTLTIGYCHSSCFNLFIQGVVSRLGLSLMKFTIQSLVQWGLSLNGTVAANFSMAGDERYDFIAPTVRRFGYRRLKRAQKAVVLRFLDRV